MLLEAKKKAPPPKVIKPLTNEEVQFYSQIFHSNLQALDNNLEDQIATHHIEKIMNQTQFKLFDDPEAAAQNEMQIDPHGTGYFD